MFPILLVPAQVQTAPALPPGFPVPEGLRIKTGTYQVTQYDQDTFEMLPSMEKGPVRIPVAGRTWRFQLEGATVREGIFSLLQKLRPALAKGGWAWQWEQRNVAKRPGPAGDTWFKASPSGGAALQVVIIQPGQPRALHLTRPQAAGETLVPDKDFPYLTPWFGARLVTSAPPTPGPPVATTLPGGKQGFIGVNWIEKEYALPEAPSPYEFVLVYRNALQEAGWEIEGDTYGTEAQIQALYAQDGREIQLILRLVGDAMAVSVADVAAQKPK